MSTTGLDGGVKGTTNTFVCRACTTLCHDSRVASLAGVPVCTRCRDAYNNEQDAAADAVDDRWLAKLYSEEEP